MWGLYRLKIPHWQAGYDLVTIIWSEFWMTGHLCWSLVLSNISICREVLGGSEHLSRFLVAFWVSWVKLQYLKTRWHSPHILVYQDPLRTYLLVFVPSILTLKIGVFLDSISINSGKPFQYVHIFICKLVPRIPPSNRIHGPVIFTYIDPIKSQPFM